MKKCIYIFTFILIAGLSPLFNPAFGQCPGCAISMSCTSTPAKPTICPAVMPDGIAMQPYNQDVSFYLPANFDDAGSGYNVDLNQLDVLNVTGLPFGLNFQTDASPSNIYYPTSNPPTSEHGCGKICGTPLIAGTYIITVFVLAHVTVTSFGIQQTSNTSFDLPLTILPNSSSNGSFTIDNPSGCTPLSTGFQNLLPSNGHAGYSYLWSFGNGNQSTLENPPSQNYNTPGLYTVSLLTTVDTLGYFLSDITVMSANGCDDGIWSDPDYYFKLLQGSTEIYSSSYVLDDAPPVSFSFSPFTMVNGPYTLEIWEYDDGMLGGDDHCGDVGFNGYSSGTHTLTSGSLIVSITIDHPVINLTATDTIEVFPSPAVSAITFAPNDSVCDGDTVNLGITPIAGCTYQWYHDTSAIMNATDPSFPAIQPGIYYCEVMNSYGCRGYSNNQKVVIIPNPPKPTYWIIGNTLHTNPTGYYLQWYYEGSAIPGETGTTYEITASGNYFLTASNNFGCTSISDTVYATYFSIAENQQNTSFRLFPNPNRGSFSAEFELTEAQEVVLQVNDLTGKVIYEENMGIQSGFIHKDINLNPVSSGMYIVTFKAGGIPFHQMMNIN